VAKVRAAEGAPRLNECALGGPRFGPLDIVQALTFLARLQAKLDEWEAKLALLRGTPIVAYHNSWPYFARRFRLNFMDFIEIKPGVAPSASHLARLIETMRKSGARRARTA
jgi:ABC-type Zn uptake system ZnuABC Zn-binding protein ZnuA